MSVADILNDYPDETIHPTSCISLRVVKAACEALARTSAAPQPRKRPAASLGEAEAETPGWKSRSKTKVSCQYCFALIRKDVISRHMKARPMSKKTAVASHTLAQCHFRGTLNNTFKSWLCWCRSGATSQEHVGSPAGVFGSPPLRSQTCACQSEAQQGPASRDSVDAWLKASPASASEEGDNAESGGVF